MTKKELDPNSPFNWRMRTEPSIFAKDVNFRHKNTGISREDREQQLTDYKQFGSFSLSKYVGKSKKQPNKHEL